MNEVCLLFTEDVLHYHSYGFHLNKWDKESANLVRVRQCQSGRLAEKTLLLGLIDGNMRPTVNDLIAISSHNRALEDEHRTFSPLKCYEIHNHDVHVL